MSFYHIRAITSLEELNPLRSFWTASQWHPNADFDFFRLIVGVRPNVLSPCVFVVTAENEVIALLAARIENSFLSARLGYASLAKFRTRQLVIIDGAFMGNKSTDIWRGLLTFIDDFMLRHQIDLALFEQIRIDTPYYREALEIFGYNRLRNAREVSKHWLMELPKTWDEFLRSRSKKHRYWLKRLENILNKEFPGAWKMQLYRTISEVEKFASAAEEIASSTYHRALGVGFVRNDESIQRLQLEAKQGRLRGYILSLQGTPKAFWHCSVHKNTLHLCSTGYSPSHRYYELGTVLLMKVFQDHCEGGGTTVDFGLGEAGYKQRFGSENYFETSLFLFAKTFRSTGLNAINSFTRSATKVAKDTLDNLSITQKLKTFWRRRLEKTHKNNETNDSTP